METIKLAQGEWHYDPASPLGKPGGFGEVFRGNGPSGEVAVKRLKITASDAAHRELDIAKNLRARTLEHVVPILDAGQDADSDRYYLVMPVCDKNLQQEINQAGGNLKLDVVLEALRAIVAGLLEVKDIVHRDLKPANVLFHEGRWKLADFGIAKFVEDSTSLETLRASLTPPYAAPEQWRLERPTAATDVYALGCIVYALTTGRPPFVGTLDQIRDAHLNAVPKPMTSCPPRLATFASLMLRKPPEARPTSVRCREVLAEDHLETKALTPARHALAKAAAQVEERTAREDAERIHREQADKRRAELVKSAIFDLNALVGKVRNEVQSTYEQAKPGWKGMLEFGAARFGLQKEPDELHPQLWYRSDLQPLVQRLGWDILVSSVIGVTVTRIAKDYTWSATLFFADRKDGSGYRWYEVAFYTSALVRQRDRDEPYALELHEADFFHALSPAMHRVEIAYGPLAIDGENEEQFIERWIGLIAKAASGELSRPMSMPINTFP